MLEISESVLQSKLFWGTAFVFGIYLYLKLVIFNYWKKLGIPHENPTVPVGNALDLTLGKKCPGELFQESYERFKSNPFHGVYMFLKPHLVINDPDLIRLIMVKDFVHFHDRGLYFNNDVDPLSGHLFFLPGEEWKFMRSKLTPTFTSGKIKLMFPLVEKVAEDLNKALADSVDESSIVEIRDLLSRYTTDIIASIAFGVECNSLKNPHSEFHVYGQKVADNNPGKLALVMFFPKLLDILRIPVNSKDVSNFFNTVFSDVVASRRANRVIRQDFLHLLIQLIDHGEIEDDEGIVIDKEKNGTKSGNTETITMSEACAQAFIFFIAGFETSSGTSTYCLHEMALDPDIQDTLRQEINDKLGDRHELTYEDLHAMPYLDKLVSETLRKYPIVPILNRVCIKDYKVPNSNYCIPKGMNIVIPVLGLHKDPDIFPDPEKFKPDRFNADEVAKRHAFTYLPFGEGPRNCIGKRFGLIQVKVALIKIISQYKLSVCHKTDLRVAPTERNLLFIPRDDVFLKIERISK